MKNVAKCDTWCELQNPVNHRVFERKLRPKPSGRGHVCLGVTHRVAPTHFLRCVGSGAEIGLPCASACGWPKMETPRVARTHDEWWRKHGIASVVPSAVLERQSRPLKDHCGCARVAPTATPGQAGLPAEFKHINKRRKRNLQGFP